MRSSSHGFFFIFTLFPKSTENQKRPMCHKLPFEIFSLKVKLLHLAKNKPKLQIDLKPPLWTFRSPNFGILLLIILSTKHPKLGQNEISYQHPLPGSYRQTLPLNVYFLSRLYVIAKMQKISWKIFSGAVPYFLN